MNVKMNKGHGNLSFREACGAKNTAQRNKSFAGLFKGRGVQGQSPARAPQGTKSPRKESRAASSPDPHPIGAAFPRICTPQAANSPSVPAPASCFSFSVSSVRWRRSALLLLQHLL
ncbi:MAG: hypothetical protein HFF73_07275 [Oscillospiraceae bacterium]|nr:hypothetical protein [Oscillospiraceae bacterium]